MTHPTSEEVTDLAIDASRHGNVDRALRLGHLAMALHVHEQHQAHPELAQRVRFEEGTAAFAAECAEFGCHDTDPECVERGCNTERCPVCDGPNDTDRETCSSWECQDRMDQFRHDDEIDRRREIAREGGPGWLR